MRAAREHSPDVVNRSAITIIGDEPRVDIFKGMGGVKYQEAKERAKEVRIRETRVPVMSIDDLERSKQAGRPGDAVDVEALTRIRTAKGT